MAKKRETVFKEKARKVIDRLQKVWIVKTQQKSLRGTPDFILNVNGFFLAIELKDCGELDPLQKYNIRKINKTNGYACECSPETFPMLLAFMKELIDYEWKDKPIFHALE